MNRRKLRERVAALEQGLDIALYWLKTISKHGHYYTGEHIAEDIRENLNIEAKER